MSMPDAASTPTFSDVAAAVKPGLDLMLTASGAHLSAGIEDFPGAQGAEPTAIGGASL